MNVKNDSGAFNSILAALKSGLENGNKKRALLPAPFK
jgi:hypothetical protein